MRIAIVLHPLRESLQVSSDNWAPGLCSGSRRIASAVAREECDRLVALRAAEKWRAKYFDRSAGLAYRRRSVPHRPLPACRKSVAP